MTTEAKRELLESPISPNRGAAGVEVGADARAVRELWGEPEETEQIRSGLVRWSYDTVWFWLKDGEVDQIAVYAGYEGKTRGGVPPTGSALDRRGGKSRGRMAHSTGVAAG